MGVITVEGLGRVEISGDVPTPEEAGKIKRAVLALQSRRPPVQPPTPPAAQPPAEFAPQQIEAAGSGLGLELDDLAQTMRGFQQLEAPVGREFWGDHEHPLQREFVRPLAAGMSFVARTPLETGIAVAEAGPEWAGLGPEATRQSNFYELERAWREWEQGLTKGVEPEDDDIHVVASKAAGGDVGPLLSLVGRGVLHTTPGMVVALKQLPTYMGSLVGGYARESAANRGSDSVELNDLLRGVNTAAVVGFAERGAARAALRGYGGPKSLPGAVLVGGGIEGVEEYGQGWVEAIGTQLGTRDDPDLWYGVDLPGAQKRALHGLAIGTGAGTAMGALGHLARSPDARVQAEVDQLLAEARGDTVAEEAVDVAAEEVAPAPEVVPPPLPEAALEPEVEPSMFEPLFPEGSAVHRLLTEHGLLTEAQEAAPVAEEVAPAEPPGPAFDPQTALDEYRAAIDGRDPDPSEDIRTIEAILQRPGAGPWLGNMRNMALGRLEGDPFSERLRYGARRAEELWEQRRASRAEPSADTAPAPEVSVAKEVEPSPAEPVVEAVIEQAETEGGTTPGWRTQVAPRTLPVEVGPDVAAVDVQMEKDALADSIKEVRVAAEEAAAEREVAPRPSGAKIRAVVDKGAKRRRVEEIDTPAAPLSAKDALRRLALLANAATATEADIADAINDYVVAEASAEGTVSAPRNIDNIDRLKQVAAEMGRTDEEIDALLSHQQMSFAQVIDAMDSAGLRSVLTEDGRGVVIPQATADLIARTNRGEYSPTNVETAAIHSTYRSVLRARENILEAASEPGLNKRDIEALNKLDAELRVQELDALLAQRRGATPAARALRFRQYLMDEVMNMVEAQARATMKKRKPLTDKEVAEIERLWDLAENAEAEAVASEKSARAALAKAQKRLKKAEDVLRGAEEVKKGAAKKARKPRKKTPRQEAAKREAEDKPIRVSPIRKSAEQKRLEKEFKAAQKAAAKAADKVQKAKTAVRKAKRDKSEVPDKAIHPWLALYRKAFGGALVLNSSGDNSALGRQALGLAIQNPGAAYKTLGVALRAAPWMPGHRDYAKRVQEEMLASPYQRLRDAGGLQMTEVEGLSNIEGGPMESREEQWMFRALETGFFGDYLVVPSQNIFGLTLNKLRTATFDEGAAMLADIHGLDVDVMAEADLSKLEDGSPEMQFMRDLKGIGLLINVSSGRGTWPAKSIGVARHLMFAPRYTMSRFELPVRALQLAAGKGAFDEVSPQARALFMKRAGRHMAWTFGVVLMSAIAAAASDDDVTDAIDAFFDPENSDFLKMRIGDFHIDAMQGLGATWRYVWPFAFSPGRAAEEGEWPIEARPWTARKMGQLARNKLAPLMSGLASIGPLEAVGGPGGYDWRGREISALRRGERAGYGAQEALGSPLGRGTKAEAAMATLLDRVIFPISGMVTPITVQQASHQFLEVATDKDKEALQRIIPVALNFFGIGASHYEDHKDKLPGLSVLPSPPKTPIPRLY
jgi:hypothetical protein